MKLTKEQATAVVEDTAIDWQMVPDTEVRDAVGKGCIAASAVFLHKPTGDFYMLSWDEMDDEWGCDPFEYNDPNPVKVELVEKVIKSWEPV